PPEGCTQRQLLDDQDRDDEAERGQPRDPRNDEPEDEERNRGEDEPAGDPRHDEPPVAGATSRHENARSDVGRTQERAEQRRRQDNGEGAWDVRADDRERRRRETERQALPEVLAV